MPWNEQNTLNGVLKIIKQLQLHHAPRWSFYSFIAQ